VASKGLFRQEAIDAQRQKLLGELSVARPVPAWVFTILAAGFAAALLAFAFLGHYTRRERVEGYLAPSEGAVQVRAPDSGTISELRVAEGDEVEAGALIARLSLDRVTSSGAVRSEQVRQQLAQQLGTLDAEKDENRRMGAQRASQLKTRIEELRKEIGQSDAEIELLLRRVEQIRLDIAKREDLARSGFISDAQLRTERAEAFDAEARLTAAKRQRSGLQRDLAVAQAELPTIDIQQRTQDEQLARQAAALQRDLVQEDARTESDVVASVAGTVTNIAVARGESVAANRPIAVLLPKGSSLLCELLVPTRAIGFVAPGARVVLRYEAFPFQRFGQYGGVVKAVGQTVWSQGESIGPLTPREPVYRVDVALDRQSVSAGNLELRLRPGMLVSADLLLERRTVFEWIFEPVLGLRARLQ